MFEQQLLLQKHAEALENWRASAMRLSDFAAQGQYERFDAELQICNECRAQCTAAREALENHEAQHHC